MSEVAPTFEVHGLIEGCLLYPASAKQRFHLIVEEEFKNDPWVAALKSTQPLTLTEVWDLWSLYQLDPDKKTIPYYFVVKNTTTGAEAVIFNDERTMYPITTDAEKQTVKQVGAKKGLDPAHLDF